MIHLVECAGVRLNLGAHRARNLARIHAEVHADLDGACAGEAKNKVRSRCLTELVSFERPGGQRSAQASITDTAETVEAQS